MTHPFIPAQPDGLDRRLVRGASFLTLVLGAVFVVLSLTDLPLDDTARAWVAPVPDRASDTRDDDTPPPLAKLSMIARESWASDLNALSCWYLPYTPHELLVARLHQGGAADQPQQNCLQGDAVGRLLNADAPLLDWFDDAGTETDFSGAYRHGTGAALSAAIALDLGRIALAASGNAADKRAARQEAVLRLADRLALLRRIESSDVAISVRAAALQGMVYILRLTPIIIGADAGTAALFRSRAAAALDALTADKKRLEHAARLQAISRVHKMAGGEHAGYEALANELLVLKPNLYGRFCMDMAHDALAAFDPADPAASLNALRRKADQPLGALGVEAWLHPVQAAAMEPLLQHDGAALIGYLIDLIQFNELRRMLLVNAAALEQGIADEDMADFAARQDAALMSTLTGRPFGVDRHSGDLVAAPGEGDTLAYTLRLYMGRGGGGIKAEMIWPPLGKRMNDLANP